MASIWICFNAWEKPHNDESLDWISEAGVEDEVAPVREALFRAGHQVRVVPVKDITQTAAELSVGAPDFIINLCEGYQGQSGLESNVAAFWELAGLPYSGNPPLCLKLSQDKVLAKRLMAQAGIPTPPWAVWESGPLPKDLPPFPVIIKPSREDASLGIGREAVHHDVSRLHAAMEHLVAQYRQPVLIESYIEGREFNAAILECTNSEGRVEPIVLPISEILFVGFKDNEPAITSYGAKWLPDDPHFSGTPGVCPAQIEPETAAAIEAVALGVFRLLGGRDYGRVDIRMDAKGTPWVLEYNPNPDISTNGGFLRSLRASGRDYDELTAVLLGNHGIGKP